MRVRIMSLAIVGFLLSQSDAADAVITAETQKQIEGILAAYRANRAKITDLKIIGVQHFASDDRGAPSKGERQFTYYQLGSNRRLDYTYPPGQTFMPIFAGQTTRYAQRAGRAVCYEVSNRLAGVMRQGEFEETVGMFVEDCLEPSTGNAGDKIEHLMAGKQGGDWRFDVVPVKQNDAALLRVTAKRGDETAYAWFFDPSRGYQVVQASFMQTFRGGEGRLSRSAVYDVREIASGLWWNVDATRELVVRNPGEAEQRITMTQRVSEIQANTGQLSEDLFTDAALGVPKDMTIHDFSKKDQSQLLVERLVGKPAPDFTLSDLSGKSWQLSKLRGKAVLLTFSTLHCGPCVALAPYLTEWHDQLADKGLVVLTVYADESKATPAIAQFVKEKGLKHPALVDGAEVSRRYNVRGYPTNFLIDRNGVIIHAEVGFAGRERVGKRLEQLLQANGSTM